MRGLLRVVLVSANTNEYFNSKLVELDGELHSVPEPKDAGYSRKDKI